MVLFPGLNLKIELSRVAFSIFNINVYWYGLIIVMAIVVAVILCKKDSGKYNIQFEQILDLSIYILPISIICARIYYCIFSYGNLNTFFEFRNGGLAIYGGIIGAIVTIFIYCKIKQINFLDILDYIAPYLALGQAIGRWGNFVNIEAYRYGY